MSAVLAPFTSCRLGRRQSCRTPHHRRRYRHVDRRGRRRRAVLLLAGGLVYRVGFRHAGELHRLVPPKGLKFNLLRWLQGH